MNRFTLISRISTACIVLLLNIDVTQAQVSNPSSPDVGAGKKRAAVCFACHGENGIAKVPGVPHLGGQDRSYIEKALHAYREGQTRQDPTMTSMAKPLSDQDIINIAAYFSLQSRMNNGQTAAETLETIERIRPVAQVSTAATEASTASGASNAAPVKTARSAESIYQSTCVACHGSGVLNAPRFGDKTAWAPRVSQGINTLTQHAINGIRNMPAKGTCTTCSDEEIHAAVEYMVAKAK